MNDRRTNTTSYHYILHDPCVLYILTYTRIPPCLHCSKVLYTTLFYQICYLFVWYVKQMQFRMLNFLFAKPENLVPTICRHVELRSAMNENVVRITCTQDRYTVKYDKIFHQEDHKYIIYEQDSFDHHYHWPMRQAAQQKRKKFK